MFLSKFAEMIFVLLVAFGGKNAGNSPYSFQPMPSCGTDQTNPLCELSPQCEVKAWRCAPPRWSAARSLWVVPETKPVALARYRKVAASIARVAFRHSLCRDEFGVVMEDCKRSGWPENPRSLAMVAATTALWESGIREDVMGGYPPMGRGSMGEVCLMQIMPNQIRLNADWVTADEMEAYDKLKFGRERAGMEEAWAQKMLGDSPEALDRCFDVGMRALSRARWSCNRQPGGSWHYKMWAKYGRGSSCSSYGVKDDFAQKRSGTYLRMAGYRPEAGNGVGETVPEPSPNSPSHKNAPPHRRVDGGGLDSEKGGGLFLVEQEDSTQMR